MFSSLVSAKTLFLCCSLILIFLYSSFTTTQWRISDETKKECRETDVFERSCMKKWWTLKSHPYSQFSNKTNVLYCVDKMLRNKIRNLRYKPQVRGLNSMKLDSSSDPSHINAADTLHIAFVGDSRVRHLFILFITRFPDYDRIIRPNRYKYLENRMIHDEILVYSKILGLLVTFYWRPLLIENDGRDQEEFFSHWLNSNPDPQTLIAFNVTTMPTPPPDVLIVGNGIHHMVRRHLHKEKGYFRKLKDLTPILKILSQTSRVVWLSQFPSLELYGDANSTNAYVHAQKIWSYKLVADRILRKAGIDVWTSAGLFVDSYIRSCRANKRRDKHVQGYINCNDNIHAGSSALTEAIQMLFYKMCPNLELA